jgi:hypothetical protein
LSDGEGTVVRFRRTSLALVVLGSLVLFLGAFAVWAARQALNTDDWVDTSTELLEDEEIQAAVETFLVDSLFDNVDVQGELAGVLPPRLKPLAGPAASGLRELANRVAQKAVESPKVQELWAEANRAAHEQLLVIVEGKDEGALSTADGTVTLDLATIVEQIGARVGVDVAGKLPESVGEVEILKSDEIEAAQTGADLLRKASYALILISLLIYALAIGLARGRRRETVRAIGFAWIVVGIAVLAARSLAGGAIVDSLASTASVEPAIERTWAIGTSLLAASGAAVIGYGVVVVLGAALAGPRPTATAARRELAPLFHNRAAAYGVLLVIVLLVFLWAPTEGTQRLAPSILLLVLMVIGFEALRRKVVGDFPDETWEDSAGRWRERFSGARGAVRSRRGGGEDDAEEERLAKLERLQELREGGLLDDEELAAEKRRILGEKG